MNVREREWAELQKSSHRVFGSRCRLIGIVAWSFFVQAAEGATFGIVPYVCPEGLGGVCAVVGAWGNIGAVCWGMMFKFGYIGKFDKGYEAMGYIIIASSVFSIFMRIKGQKTMFGTLEDQ